MSTPTPNAPWLTEADLIPFVRESNRIEGIHREPTITELAETAGFLQLKRITISDVTNLVIVYAGCGARPRFAQGLDVHVGGYQAPRGGPHIQARLQAILDDVNGRIVDAWENHCHYEMLHPYIDGNGRSGRAIWLWQMLRSGSRAEDQAMALGFLHTFYYQTLGHQRPGHVSERDTPKLCGGCLQPDFCREKGCVQPSETQATNRLLNAIVALVEEDAGRIVNMAAWDELSLAFHSHPAAHRMPEGKK